MKAKAKTWWQLSQRQRQSILDWAMSRESEWRLFGLTEQAAHLAAAIRALTPPRLARRKGRK